MASVPSAVRFGSAMCSEARMPVPRLVGQDCPGRKPPKRVVTRPARPYKNTIESRFSAGNVKGAQPPREGLDCHDAVVRRDGELEPLDGVDDVERGLEPVEDLVEHLQSRKERQCFR